MKHRTASNPKRVFDIQYLQEEYIKNVLAKHGSYSTDELMNMDNTIDIMKDEGILSYDSETRQYSLLNPNASFFTSPQTEIRPQ